jgi:hypothetical protein
MRKRVKLKHSPERGWYVDLPASAMVAGAWLPIIPNKTTRDGVLPATDPADPALNALTCEVEIDDRYANAAGTGIDLDKLRALHRGHPRWSDSVNPPDV